MSETLEKATAALIAEIKRQETGVYFYDRSDMELFHGHPIEMTELDGGVMLADGFDMTAIARAVLMAVREPNKEIRQLGRNAWFSAADASDMSAGSGLSFTAMIDAILNGDA